MKNLILSFVLLFGAAKAQTSNNVNTNGNQNSSDCYTIKMSIKAEGLPAEYAAFGEIEMVSYNKGEKSKSETSSMMFSNVVYFDGKLITNLSESMGNKTGYTATKEEMEGLDKNKAAENKPKIEYVNDKRTIAGYECTKAIVTSIDKDKKERQTIVWFTDKLKPLNSNIRRANRRGMAVDLSDLKGMPLAMESTMNMQGMEVKSVMIATEVSNKQIDDAVFVPNTEGYTMLTFKEFQEKMRSMGGR